MILKVTIINFKTAKLHLCQLLFNVLLPHIVSVDCHLPGWPGSDNGDVKALIDPDNFKTAGSQKLICCVPDDEKRGV